MRRLTRVVALLMLFLLLSAQAEQMATVPPDEPMFGAGMATVPPDELLTNADMPTAPPDEEILDVPLRRAVIRAVGDVMSHDRQLRYARRSDGSYDYHPQYALAADSLAAADYTIANLETSIGQVGGQAYSGFPLFNAPEAMLDALKDAGVDFLTLANNHMLDRRFAGMCQTADRVEAWGFAHGGSNRTPEEREAPVVVEVNGIAIGFICCTAGTNGMEGGSPEARSYGVNYLRDMDWNAEAAKLRAAGAEVVIAVVHWDYEYQRSPSAGTVATAKDMIAAGVDVILGSHPHVVQPVEYLTVEADGGARTGLVAYSLGNFCSNQVKPYTNAGIILQFTLLEDQQGGIQVRDAAYVPTFCWRHGGDDGIQVMPSLKYADDLPAGMPLYVANDMYVSAKELRKLIGAEIAELKE